MRVTSADDAHGLELPTATSGMAITLFRGDSTSLRTSPADGDRINGGDVGSATTVETTTKVVECTAYDDTNWVCSRVESDGSGGGGGGAEICAG